MEMKKWTYTGTGVALGLDIGFVPDIVNIYDDYAGLAAKWFSEMADGEVLLASQNIDSVIGDPAPSIGTTADYIASKAFEVQIAGIPYDVAAVAAGTAPTATTIPQNTWGAFGWEVAADGTIDSGWDDAANATGYASEALAIAAILAVSPSGSHVRCFYVTVMSVNAAGFVADTDNFSDADVTYNCYSYSDRKPSSGGLTAIDETEYLVAGTVQRDDDTSETASASNVLTMRGVQIGTNAYINTSGKSYTVEAIRL